MCAKKIFPKKSISLLQGVFESPFFDGLKKKKPRHVFLMEGRPGLEAARESSRQLLDRKITPTLIADNMAGFLFYNNWVKEVWVAYQVWDKDGAVCDIGALIVAVLAKKHKVPVRLWPAAHRTRFMGRQKDLAYFKDKRIAPRGVKGYVPLVEWVPGKYITKVY